MLYSVYHNCCFADDEAEWKKKKKTRTAGDEVRLTPGSRFGVENAERVKKTSTVVKKIASTAQPEEYYGAKDSSIREPKKVRQVLLPCF